MYRRLKKKTNNQFNLRMSGRRVAAPRRHPPSFFNLHTYPISRSFFVYIFTDIFSVYSGGTGTYEPASRREYEAEGKLFR
jgi:hypothetical protein